MDPTRMQLSGGIVLMVASSMMAVASLTAIGDAQSWGVADAFAADSTRPVRRVGMFLTSVGLGLLVAATPTLLDLLRPTTGHVWMVVGWGAFAFGAMLFALAVGVTAIVMPALGELAQADAISPQQVTDRMTRQVPLALAFVGGNLMFLSWIPIGAAITHSAIFPSWLGWLVATSAVAAWLGFLHVPVFQRLAGPMWPLAILLVGLFIVRARGVAM